MKRHDRKLTDAEADELERLCIASDTRPLTREESIRCYILEGFDPDDAEWIAENGGLWRE